MPTISRYQHLLGRQAQPGAPLRWRALACAGRALGALHALGVKARLIGSLAAEPAQFHQDSDIGKVRGTAPAAAARSKPSSGLATPRPPLLSTWV